MNDNLNGLHITMRKRKNAFGAIMFQAVTLIGNHGIEGWGKTPEEAEQSLRTQVTGMLLALKDKLEKEKNDIS